MKTSKNRSTGFFIVGMAFFAIGLSIGNKAFWIIGLVLVAFALFSARKAGE
jgi:hypothetical protein